MWRFLCGWCGVVCCECGTGFGFGVFDGGGTGALFGFVVALRGGSRGYGAGGVWVGLVGLGLILVSVVGWLVVGG